MIDSLTIRDGSVIIDHNKNWTEFKKWINGNYATLRYVWGNFGNGFMDSVYENAEITSYQDERSFYKVVAIDGNILRTVVIPMAKPKSADQIDFEDNFKSDVLPVREEFDNGELFESKLVGEVYSCDAGVTNHEYTLAKSVHFEGMYYWTQGSSIGDKITLSVIDKTNLFGFGSNYVLDQHIYQVPVVPSSFGQQFLPLNKFFLNQNLTLRVTYQNEGDTAVDLGITYRWLETVA